MKSCVPVILILLLFASCSGSKKLGQVQIKDPSATENDSVEYELIIFDAGFETWFLTHSKPEWYYSQSYYESWNQRFVAEWNVKAMSSRYSRYFETTINYDPFTDYGLEINHKLFYYFLYVEKELKIPVLPPGTGPKAIL